MVEMILMECFQLFYKQVALELIPMLAVFLGTCLWGVVFRQAGD